MWGWLEDMIYPRSSYDNTYEYSNYKNRPYMGMYGGETVLFIKDRKVHLGRIENRIYYTTWTCNFKVKLKDTSITISENDIIHSFGKSDIGWGVVDLEFEEKKDV